jgi:hypothetical protein
MDEGFAMVLTFTFYFAFSGHLATNISGILISMKSVILTMREIFRKILFRSEAQCSCLYEAFPTVTQRA